MPDREKQNYSIGRVIVSFLWEQRYGFFGLFLGLGLILLITYLYNLPWTVMGYMLLLLAVLALVMTLGAFVRFWKRHQGLIQAQNSIANGFDALPEAQTLLEADYQELLMILFQKKNEDIARYSQQKSEMIDYYTLWAHQIKVPIAAQRLILDIHGADTLPIKELGSELFKVEQYVDLVLQYLRIEDMSNDLVLKSYDLEDMVRQAVRKYAPLFISKKINLNLSEITCQVITDEKWLVFVLEQLLSNALKYTTEGSVSIYLDSEEENCLVISDTGMGIAKEDLPRVFERGFTGANGRMDKKATGLGLFLCQKILDKLAHTIVLFSEPGKGVTVKLYFQQPQLTVE